MPLPELIRRSAEKILTRYCTERASSGKDGMRLSFRIGDDQATLFAERYDDSADRWTASPVALFRFSDELGQWTLHYPGQDQRWRFYLNIGPSLDLGRLVRHLDADPLHLFWE